ncbi:MAG: outer membrane protein assembly factor BamE [Porticoccaceae bacterium]
MLHHFRAIAFILAIATLPGCSYLKLPSVYKFPIQQGNIVTQEMVDQLRPGMTRLQVRYVLGTPLVADTFNQSRWDYWYSVKLPNGFELREQVAVHFTDDALSGITGDYLPSAANNGAPAAGSSPADAVNAAPTEPEFEAPLAVPIPEESEIGVEDQSSVLDQDI